MAGALLGRRNRVVSGTAVPLAQGVVAKGTSNASRSAASGGPCTPSCSDGAACAGRPEARYLVSDPSKHDPFWVSQDEVSNIVPPAGPRVRERPSRARVRALGYVSVTPTGESPDAEFDGQVDAIDRHCEQQGWDLVEVVRDVGPSPGDLERQGLLYALEKIGRGEATCIVVSDLARLSGSAADLGGILDRLRRSHGRLVALDIGLDTASPGGQMAAQALASVSSWEHERSRKGLAAAAAARTPTVEPPPVQDVGGGQGAHPDDADGRHDPPGDRGRPQQRGRADPARRGDVAALERPVRGRLPQAAETAAGVR